MILRKYIHCSTSARTNSRSNCAILRPASLGMEGGSSMRSKSDFPSLLLLPLTAPLVPLVSFVSAGILARIN